MNTLITALNEIERQLSSEKGEIALLACFEPADSPGYLEVVFSAAWAPRHNLEALQLFVSYLDRVLPPSERLEIARIAVVEPSDDDVQRLNARFSELTPGEIIEVRNEEHFGYPVVLGFIFASHDYWRFIKQLFPQAAEFIFFTRDGDLHIRVSWKLGNDSAWPTKRSRTIIIRISREAIDDHIYIDDSRQRHMSEVQIVEFLRSKLRTFNPEHAEPRYTEPPVEEWPITTALFQRPAAFA
jgi:hypothetical protein